MWLGWVYITHVCRHWRQVALDDSTLWTHFSTSSAQNKDWIAKQLSRARNAPLVIELHPWVGKNTISLFTPHISHTRELCLRNMPSIPYSTIMQEVSTQKAPVLERFELGVDTDPIKHVGHSFFKGSLPKLRIFCISQILFPLPLVHRGRLKQLKAISSKRCPPCP